MAERSSTGSIKAPPLTIWPDFATWWAMDDVIHLPTKIHQNPPSGNGFFYAEKPRTHSDREQKTSGRTWTNQNYSQFEHESSGNLYRIINWRNSLVGRHHLQS